MAKKPNRQIKKAFALSSIVGALLMSANNGNPKLTTLKVQIDRAMKVFSIRARKDYYMISADIKELWVEMAEKHNNSLDVDEIEVFVEMVLSLLPKNDMKEFLGINFKTVRTLSDSKKSALLMTVLDLDRELNTMFGTQQTATRESLGAVMVKPLKQKSAKKERNKAVPRRIKKLRRRVKWAKERAKDTA